MNSGPRIFRRDGKLIPQTEVIAGTIDICGGLREKQADPNSRTRRHSATIVNIAPYAPTGCSLKSRRLGIVLAAATILFGNLLSVLGQQKPAAELRTVAAIRDLTVEQTRQKIPVHLQGIVTFYDDRLYSRFIQDSSGGIYLQFPANIGPPALTPGQLVDVTGICNPGEYAPVVEVNQLRVAGEGPLPAPKVVTYEQLASGVEDSQFVEITGVVRSARVLEDSQYHLLEIATGGGRLLVYARDLPVKRAGELVDCTVRVRGVCSTKFNHKRQLFAIRLMVPKPEDLEITQRTPQDLFAIGARPIGSLLQFAPQETYGHRVKVAGTVTYYEPGKTIFLQDGEQGVEIQTTERGPLQVGDWVEVLGFVSQGEYTPMLQDATYRKISTRPPPNPVVLTPDDALKGNYDCCLIRVDARVLDRTLHGPVR